MTPENFVYWLQGFLKVAKPTKLNKTQIEEIQNHLKLVLNKATPDLSKPNICTDQIGGGLINYQKDNKTYCCSLTNLPNQNLINSDIKVINSEC